MKKVTILDPDFTSIVELDETGEQTVVIGMLDGRLRAHLLDQIANQRITFLAQSDVVRFAAKSWTLKDQNGNPIKLEIEDVDVPGVGRRKGVSSGSLTFLPHTVISRIASRIIALNYPAEQDEKNSPLPSTP